MTFLPMLLAGLLTLQAAALVTPDSATMDRLKRLLSEAKAADVQYQQAETNFKLGLEDRTSVNATRDLRATAWKTLIDGVLIAYDLAQPSFEDPAVARLPKIEFTYGRYAGEKRDWVINYSDLPLGELIASKTKLDDMARFQGHRKKANAITMANGATVIFKADYGSPAELARTLFHERIHFRQFAESKYRDKTSPDFEVEAWSQVLKNIDKFGFDPSVVEKERKAASYMVVKESLKAITARGQRNMAQLGSFIKNKLAAGEGDLEEVDTSLEGFAVNEAVADSIRADSRALNERVESSAAGRKLAEVAGKFCRRGFRRDYLVSEYAAVRIPTGEPADIPTGSCEAGVFSVLWGGKKAGLSDPGWESVEQVVSSAGSNPGGCVSFPGFPCPTPRQIVTADRAQSPIPAVAATVPAQAHLAKPQDRAGWLRDLSSNGCSDPWAYPQSDMDRYWGALLGMAYDEEMPARLGLEGCRDRLFRTLMRMAADRSPEVLSIEVFARTAEGARNSAREFVPDEMLDVPGVQSPTVPTCRHHPWCRTWGN